MSDVVIIRPTAEVVAEVVAKTNDEVTIKVIELFVSQIPEEGKVRRMVHHPAFQALPRAVQNKIFLENHGPSEVWFVHTLLTALEGKNGLENTSASLKGRTRLVEGVRILRNLDRPHRVKPDPKTREAREAVRRARKLATSTAGPEKGSSGSKPAPTGGKTKNAKKRARAKA